MTAKRISTLGRLGDVSSRLGRYEEAITYYGRIEGLTNDTPVWAYIGLANAHEVLGQRDDALRNLRLALDLMRDSQELQNRLKKLEASVN